jgi:alpha-glucosidase (family GH31 glycosyl hydrolase)
MLIAPILESGNKRQVYLPPGTWTSLETNREYPGRQTISVETPALPVFARNGAIVPLDSENGMGLHYFPKAGEFFLLEKEMGQYTQIHAAPALDILRLEIESKKERVYQWVVHHVERPVDVGLGEQKFPPVDSLAALTDRTWFYDAAAKNLLLKVHVKAGEDNIVNLSW